MSTQRTQYHKGTLSKEKVAQLEGIGFVWRVGASRPPDDAKREAATPVATFQVGDTTFQVGDRVVHFLGRGNYHATIIAFTRTKVRIQRDDREMSQLCLPQDLTKVLLANE